MENYVLILALLDFLPVTFMLSTQIYLIYKLWNKKIAYSIILIFACAVSIVSGYLIALNKLMFAFGLIEFRVPDIIHLTSSFGILLAGIVVFVTFKTKKFQSATYVSIGMISGFINLAGIILMIVSYFKVSIKNKDKLLITLCVASTITAIILVVTNMSFDFNTSVLGHTIGEITNTILELLILISTIKSCKYLIAVPGIN